MLMLLAGRSWDIAWSANRSATILRSVRSTPSLRTSCCTAPSIPNSSSGPSRSRSRLKASLHCISSGACCWRLARFQAQIQEVTCPFQLASKIAESLELLREAQPFKAMSSFRHSVDGENQSSVSQNIFQCQSCDRIRQLLNWWIHAFWRAEMPTLTDVKFKIIMETSGNFSV